MKLNRVILVVLFLFIGETNMAASCLGVNTIAGSIDNATAQATGAIDDAIRSLNANSASWQTVLQDLEGKLASDTQTTIRNEVQNLANDTTNNIANQGRCSVDFVVHRVTQGLQTIEANLLHQAPPPPDPTVCADSPVGIDLALWQENRIPSIDISGYDLDGPLTADLVTATGTTDYTSALSHTSQYELLLNLGGNGIKLSSASLRIEVKSAGKALTSIPILTPVTPVCQTKQVQINAPDLTLIPTKIGIGDSDFDGNGPAVSASLSLTMSGPNVMWNAFMHAKETASDWTEVQGSSSGSFYVPESGWKVEAGVPSSSAVAFTATYNTGINTPERHAPGPGGPVQYFDVVGDTDGADVGRTRMTVHFLPNYQITVVQNANCVTPSVLTTLALHNQVKPATLARLNASMKKE